MNNVIDNLARAIRKLAAAGVEHSVVTADHGHLFFPSDRDESMRIDSPGGTKSICTDAAGKQVGAVGMAIDAELDRATGCVTFLPGKPVTVAFL
jgi:hypothetical protein